ncbi:MAG: acetyl/propionyl-CoA carboxylase subunit alpha, partial [Desulfobacterales bacterium]|nr:acetyl/propionyl-CoA carboxylase subunit alpha [Desulfobacterales bacterium]
RPRHIEVQVVGDGMGNVVHLFERECSIQRRFQKIIEESPAPELSPELRSAMCNTALDIARTSNYRNAGTVEFILTPDNEFYFLEMNTRLQVEHPVTEMVTGLDLVELQVRVAQGERLDLSQEEVRFQGHALEFRIYAEDPARDFLPATGTLLDYHFPSGPGIRLENGFAPGMRVSSAFDPMLAKLIVHGKDRGQALDRATKALARTRILGVTTNVDYLGQIIAHPAFHKGEVDTGFIPRHEMALAPPSPTQVKLLLAATALNSRAFTDPALAPDEPHASIGNWRN